MFLILPIDRSKEGQKYKIQYFIKKFTVNIKGKINHTEHD